MVAIKENCYEKRTWLRIAVMHSFWERIAVIYSFWERIAVMHSFWERIAVMHSFLAELTGSQALIFKFYGPDVSGLEVLFVIGLRLLFSSLDLTFMKLKRLFQS